MHANDSKRRTQIERRETARAALLAAATELLVERGAGGVTLATVGERAGYSRGLVTHHFGSKAALLVTLTETMQAGFTPRASRLPAGLERLLTLICEYLQALAHDQGWRAYVLLWAQASTDPLLATVFRRRDDAFRAEVADNVRAGQRAGEVDQGQNAVAVAVAVVGELRGIGLQWLLEADAIDLEVQADAVKAQWRAVLASPSSSGRASSR